MGKDPNSETGHAASRTHRRHGASRAVLEETEAGGSQDFPNRRNLSTGWREEFQGRETSGARREPDGCLGPNPGSGSEPGAFEGENPRKMCGVHGGNTGRSREPDLRKKALKSSSSRKRAVTAGRQDSRRPKAPVRTPGGTLQAWRCFEGSCVAEKRGESRFGGSNQVPTRRTPGSAAGCNKPARLSTEKTAKVVGNHEDGTGLVPWQGRAEAGEICVTTQGSKAGVDDESPARWRGVLWKPQERRLVQTRQGRQESVSRRGFWNVGGSNHLMCGRRREVLTDPAARWRSQ